MAVVRGVAVAATRRGAARDGSDAGAANFRLLFTPRALAACSVALALAACDTNNSPTEARSALRPSEKIIKAVADPDRPRGIIEICKIAGAPSVTGTFSFALSGPNVAAQTVTAPVGGCTGPIEANQGEVTITELAQAGIAVSGITATRGTSTDNRLVSSDLPRGIAVVSVPNDGVANETLVRYTNVPTRRGYIEVCKIAGAGVDIGTVFTFTVDGLTNILVPAGAGPNGNCSGPLEVPAGQVRVTEAQLEDYAVSAITATDYTGANRLSDVPNNPDLANRTALVDVTAGMVALETVARVTNVRNPRFGQIKVCKVAGTGVDVGTNFDFSTTIGGGAAIGSTIPAGPAAQGGTCQFVDGNVAVGTQVRVAETVPAGFAVDGIAISDPGSRPAGSVTLNPGAGTAQFTVIEGVNVVTFRNVRTRFGQLKVCKVAGTGVAVGTNFDFSTTIGGGAAIGSAIPAGPAEQGGTCQFVDGNIAVGTQVVVTEAAPTNARVSAIALSDLGSRPAGSFSLDLATRTGRFTIIEGVNVITFTNVGTNRLEVCKVAGANVAVGTVFSFTGTPGGALNIAAGAGPTGNCATLGTFDIGTTVRVAEAIPAGFNAPVITGGTTVSAGVGEITITASPTPNRITFTNSRPGRVCTRSQGFFKNHEEVVNRLLQQSSPYVVGGKLNIGTSANPILLTAEQIDAALSQPTRGDQLVSLRRQLIAAELNVIANGGNAPADVLLAISQAQSLLSGGSSPRSAGTLQDILEAFNVDNENCTNRFFDKD